MKYIFVINGREDKVAHIREDLAAQLEGLDIIYQLYVTEGVGDGIRFVRIYCDLHPEEKVMFIACGGSGTLNEVASGVTGFKDKTIGFLSYGQTNDFIKYYPQRDFCSLRKLLEGKAVKVDILRANNWYSLNMINIGFDAYVSYEGNQLMDSGMDFKKAYAIALLKCMLTKRRNRIQITADGVRLNKKNILLCSVANAQWCGGMFHFAPDAAIDDGLMDICLVKPCSSVSFMIMLKHFIKGDQFANKFCLKRLTHCRARHLDVESDTIIFISPDGEICADINFSIDVLPGEINFMIPAL